MLCVSFICWHNVDVKAEVEAVAEVEAELVVEVGAVDELEVHEGVVDAALRDSAEVRHVTFGPFGAAGAPQVVDGIGYAHDNADVAIDVLGLHLKL